MYLEIAKEFVNSDLNIKNIERVTFFLRYLSELLDIGGTNLLTPHYDDSVYKDAHDAMQYLKYEPKMIFLNTYHWILWDRVEKKFDNGVIGATKYDLLSHSGTADEFPFSFNQVHSFNIGHAFDVYASDKPVTINYTDILIGFVIGPSYKYTGEPSYLSEVYSPFKFLLDL